MCLPIIIQKKERISYITAVVGDDFYMKFDGKFSLDRWKFD